MTLIPKTFELRDDFPPGFYEALGAFAVAFGRVEYTIKLAVKSFSGKEFNEGMTEAASSRHFHDLCERAKTVASKKLREPQERQFAGLIDEVIKLASERNANLHAFWNATSEGKVRRISPYWNRETTKLESKNRLMTVEELNRYTDKLRILHNSIQALRTSDSNYRP